VATELFERLDAVGRLDALKSFGAHEVDHGLAKARLVVDDQTAG
jgi:hypothetical protein